MCIRDSPYGVSREDERIDYDALEKQAKEVRPKLIIGGSSAYSRIIDFERMAAIAHEVGALFMVDMAHFAGLVAGGEYPNPVKWADIVTTTTHKTLRGPRGGIIMCREELAKTINKAVSVSYTHLNSSGLSSSRIPRHRCKLFFPDSFYGYF